MGLDPYAFENLAVHLSRSGKLDHLYHLLLKPGWKLGSFNYDPSTLRYSQDVEIAWQSISEQIKGENGLDEKPVSVKQLGWLAALAWLSARLKQSASHLYPTLIEAILLVHGREKAYQYILNIPDMIWQAECRIGIARGLYCLGQRDEAVDVLKDTYTFLESLPADLFNENLVRQGDIVVALAQFGLIETACEYNNRFQKTLENEVKRAGGITDTARFAHVKAYVAVGMLDEAVSVIKSIPDKTDQENIWLNTLTFQINTLGSNSLLARLYAAMGESFLETKEKRDVRAAIMAGLGKYQLANQLLGENPEPVSKLKIIQAFVGYLYRSSQKDEVSEYLHQAYLLVWSLPKSDERIKLSISFIIGLYRNLADVSTWLAFFREIIYDLTAGLDSSSLSEMALALAFLGDLESAQSVIVRNGDISP